MNRALRGSPAIAAAALLLFSALPVAQSSPERPAQFEVLQAVFHPFSAGGATSQNLSDRCVLMENFVGANGTEGAFSREAAYALVNNTTRGELAYVELDPSSIRFSGYYRGSLLPAAIFDGTGQEYGGTPQSLEVFERYFAAKKVVQPGASISVTGNIVINVGHIDYDIRAPVNLAEYLVTVRAFLVEDHVASAGRELRFVVREYLVGERLSFTGNVSFSGRINFTKEPGWVESQLAAIVFVQVDALPPADRGPLPARYDILGAVILPFAVFVTGATLAIIFARYVAAERRARFR